MSEYTAKFAYQYNVTDDEMAELQKKFGPDLDNYFYQALTGALVLMRMEKTNERLAKIERILKVSTNIYD